MDNVQIEEKITHIKIDGVDIYLHDYEFGRDKITISDSWGNNYSYFWDAMGNCISDFIKEINSNYFANKLIGYKSNYEMDVKNTFTEIRKYIKNEMELPYYKHMEFQKNMREVLKNFQETCEEHNDKNFFVSTFFSNFINRLNYYLIDNRYERNRIEESFNSISEHWYFIVDKPSKEYQWLKKFHKKLISKL